MAEKNIDVRFRFKDEFTSGFQKSMSALTGGTKSAQRAWKSVGKVGQSITNVGKTLTASVTVPIAGLSAAAVKNFGDVDKTMRLVKSTMGDAAWATGDLTKAMKTAASNSTFTMQEAADASLNFARQGYNAKDSANMLAPAMNLAAGTATDLSTVTSGLGNTMKMFSINTKDASATADIFAKAQAAANTTTGDLLDAMSVAGPIASSVGWKVQDLSTVIASLGNSGISGSEAANGLKTGLARLASPAKDAAGWMSKLKINIFDAKGNMDDAVTVQKKLHDSFATLSSKEQMAAASAIFGKNQMSKWMALIRTSPSDFQKLNQTIGDSAGSAKTMSDALMSGVGGSIEKLKSTFDVFKYNFGSVVGQVVKPLIDNLTKLLDKFNSLDTAQQKQIVKMLLVAAAIGPVILGFGKAVVGIAKFGEAISKIQRFASMASAGFQMMGGAAKIGPMLVAGITSPAGIVIAALAGIVVATILVVKNWDKIKAAAKSVASVVGPAFKGLGSVFKSIGSIFVAIGKNFGAFFSGFANGFKKFAGTSTGFNNIKSAFKSLGATLQPVYKVYSKFYSAVAKGISKLQPIFKKFGSVVGSILGKTLSIAFTGFTTLVTAGIRGIIVNVKSIITVVKTVASVIKVIIKGIRGTFKGLTEFITGVFTGNWKKAWQGVKDIFKSQFEMITGIAKTVINGVTSVINNVISGINSIKVNVPDWVPGIGGKKLGFNIPTIPQLAKGTKNWKGGLAEINERGGEIVDLPKGSRVYPHDESVKMARQSGRNTNISIAKLADSIVVREDSDIDKIGDAIVRKIQEALGNSGSETFTRAMEA